MLHCERKVVSGEGAVHADRRLLHFVAASLGWMLWRLPAIQSKFCSYLIAANASTCNNKSGLDNCGARIVVLFGEGGPK